jgi:hypothetical protein
MSSRTAGHRKKVTLVRKTHTNHTIQFKQRRRYTMEVFAKPTSKIIKEAQSTVAFAILEKITREGQPMTQVKQHEAMYTMYHGETDSAGNRTKLGMVDWFLNAQGVFAQLFVPVSSTADGKHEILPHLTGSAGRVCIGETITKELMLQSTMKNENLIDGRSLYKKAHNVSANLRKALVFAKNYLDGNDDPPSGRGMRDYCLHILREMKRTEGSAATQLAAVPDSDDDDDADDGGKDEDSCGRRMLRPKNSLQF